MPLRQMTDWTSCQLETPPLADGVARTSYSVSPIISSSTCSIRLSQSANSGSSWIHMVFTMHSFSAWINEGTDAVRKDDWPSSRTFASRILINPLPRSTGSGDDRYSEPDANTARFTWGPVMRWAWV